MAKVVLTTLIPLPTSIPACSTGTIAAETMKPRMPINHPIFAEGERNILGESREAKCSDSISLTLSPRCDSLLPLEAALELARLVQMLWYRATPRSAARAPLRTTAPTDTSTAALATKALESRGWLFVRNATMRINAVDATRTSTANHVARRTWEAGACDLEGKGAASVGVLAAAYLCLAIVKEKDDRDGRGGRFEERHCGVREERRRREDKGGGLERADKCI